VIARGLGRCSVAVVSVIGAAAAPPADATQSAGPSGSSVVVHSFVLEPSGVLFSMHPTEARIVVTAAASAPLKVCQEGTTFSRHWTGGCRRLGRLPLALPTSGGAVHVGFRVVPANGRATRVTVLRVRWHCVDHDFLLARGTTHLTRPTPVFDC
jgi:hypothetical protein